MTSPVRHIVILSWVILLLAATASPMDHDTRSVATRYMQATFHERDIVKASMLLADDVRFIDPTGTIFGGSLATGIHGRDAMLRHQRSWNVVSSAFR
jgi:hypothetical protein